MKYFYLSGFSVDKLKKKNYSLVILSINIFQFSFENIYIWINIDIVIEELHIQIYTRSFPMRCFVLCFQPGGEKLSGIDTFKSSKQTCQTGGELIASFKQHCNNAKLFFQRKSLDVVCLGTGDAAGDKLMNCCVHACNLMGAVCVKQAETCTVTLQHQVQVCRLLRRNTKATLILILSHSYVDDMKRQRTMRIFKSFNCFSCKSFIEHMAILL